MSEPASSSIGKDARIAELEAALAARDTLIDTLRHQLAQLRRMTFGQSSEKLALQIEQLELADSRTSERAPTERPSPVRALPNHLPRAGNCTCPDCGGALRPLRQDSDEQLDIAPVQWRVIRTVRPKYSCHACDRIVQAPVPVKATARGKANFATLAHVVVYKFDHHLPLYRQAEMMAAQDLDIDRSTLAGWAGQAAHLLDPIVSRIREEGLKAAKLHTDDTPVPMLVPGKGRTAQARLWAYVVDDRASGAATPALAWYRFTPDRSSIHPQSELKAFTGLLQASGYAGYDKLYQEGASRRSPAGRISDARSSSATSRARPRSPPTCSIASLGFTGSKRRSAANRPISGADTDRSRPDRRSTRFAARSTTPCAACRPGRRWQRRSPMAASAGTR